jgi:hypothetical protein
MIVELCCGNGLSRRTAKFRLWIVIDPAMKDGGEESSTGAGALHLQENAMLFIQRKGPDIAW